MGSSGEYVGFSPATPQFTLEHLADHDAVAPLGSSAMNDVQYLTMGDNRS